VKLLSFGVQGTVLEIDEGEIVVQAGAIRTRVTHRDIEIVRQAEVSKPVSDGLSLPRRAASPGIQIDLRGQRVEDALYELDRYLDDAAMATLPWVRIIHGKGTGKLRREVRRYLETHPLVSSHEIAPLNEGGEGATIVRMVNAG
jgi:DNA mismatch repair protein MutS2